MFIRIKKSKVLKKSNKKMEIVQKTLKEPLKKYLEAQKSDYESVLSQINHSYFFEGIEAKLRLHHVKFDGNNQPKFEALAKILSQSIINFCISAKNRPDQPWSGQEAAKLYQEALKKFTQFEKSGECGELLLYFLLETVLEAPQIVCKMELKTNRKDEVKGTDGIHINWNDSTNCLNVFLGEAKLHESISSAITSTFKSIGTLHRSKKIEEEIILVTSHYKHLDDPLKKEVSKFIDSSDPYGEYKIVHACLIGYDWKEYEGIEEIGFVEFKRSFESQYLLHGKSVFEKLNKQFENFEFKHFEFEFFILPFNSVGEFRKEFIRILKGD